MALNEIKKMADDLAAVQKELVEAKEELKGDIEAATAERKKSFTVETVVTEKQVAHASEMLQGLYLRGIALGVEAKSFPEYSKHAEVIEKAIVPSDLTSWVAEEFSDSVIEALELELKVPALFGNITMPDNVQTFSIPARTGNLSAYLIAPAASAIESAITAGKVSFTVEKVKTFTSLSDEANIEVVASIVELSRKELVRSLARAFEDAIINGDTTLADANDPKKSFDGLKKFGIANSVDMGGVAITGDKILDTRKALGIQGINPADLVMVVNPSVYYQLVNLKDAAGNYLVTTVDKFGPSATVHTGTLGKIYGMDIIVTEYIADDLEASGAPDAGTGATTAVLIFNADYFTRVSRGSVEIETDRSILTGTDQLVSYHYISFGKIYTAGSPISALVNILP